MSITSAIIDPVLNLNGTAAYALVGGLAFAEAAVFLGFVLPGETAVILGGVLAYRHAVSLPVMITVVVLAAIVGDSVGYEVGKRYGQRILALSVFDRHRSTLDTARDKLLALGGRAVFLARFTAFLRAVVPGLAGTVNLPYRRFVLWNAAGGLTWGIGFTMLGYLGGASYKKIESYAGTLSTAVLALVAVVAVVLIIRARRTDRTGPPEVSDDTDGIDAPSRQG